ACLLKNMWKMIDKYNIEVQPHHRLWYTDGFEFPKNDRKIDIMVTDKIQVDKNFNEMLILQKEILKLNINEEIKFISDNEEEDIEMEEVQIK
ncbi:hypothetical protein CU097_000865, partial [Rhizopus azygosporus]